MSFELTYAKSQRPLPTLWASGLLIIGGVFFLLPMLFTTLVGRPWLYDPRLLDWFLATCSSSSGSLWQQLLSCCSGGRLLSGIQHR